MDRQFITLHKENFFKRVWHGRKDYNFHRTFGAAAVSLIPNWLTRILDQGQSPSCTAYTAVAIREAMTGKQYDPEMQWQAELQIYGSPVTDGVDLDTQMATCVKIGFFPIGQPLPTDKATSYYSVYPPFWSKQDTFDAIKVALLKAPVSVGLTWYREWDNAPGGIVPHTFITPLGGHDTKVGTTTNTAFVTVVQFNGIEYLVIQNSWGEGVGDKGKFYFDRYMANRCFTLGAKALIDDPNAKVVKNGLFLSLYVQLKNLLVQLMIHGNTGTWPPPPTPPAHVSRIPDWADAIASAEGANPKYNNPGNLKYSTLTASWGATKGFNATDGGSICKFPTYLMGLDALCNFLKLGAENQLVAFHQARTLAEFTKVYAGNPPPSYLEKLTTALKVASNIDVSSFL